MPAELPLVPSAVALAFSGLFFLLRRRGTWSHLLGTLLVLTGAAMPVALQRYVDPARAGGRALWEWSAVGGPTIEASYRVDALAAVAASLTVAFAGAALATAARAERRHPALPGLLLAVGLVGIATVVAADLVAAIVLLAVLSALTVLALLAVAPAAATARAAAYLAIGLQAWVVAALLVSRHGSASFQITEIPSGAVTLGATLAATLGALLFAGLYPVVAWSFDGDDVPDPGPLGGLILMPAGIAGSLLLLRLVGTAELEPARIALPALDAEPRLVLAVLVLGGVVVSAVRSRGVPGRPIVVGAAALALLGLYPMVTWAHLVLLGALLTIVYAAVTSLAVPDRWETVRSDLALVVLWIGIASGSSLAVAGGLLALGARAVSALATAQWLVPHRDYVALVTGSAAYLAGVAAAIIGAATAPDPAARALGVLAAALLVGLELTQVGRHYRIAEVPAGLDVTSGIAALLVAALGAAGTVALEPVAREQLAPRIATDLVLVGTVAGTAAAVVILARTVRPLLPYLELVAERSRPAIRVLDPVPVGVGIFRTLELATVRANAAFGLFESRAGVWLATSLIVALLVWASGSE
jgi:hypothetical protein